MPFTVLPASSADSHEIAKLLRRSIVELCGADHDNNETFYQPWLKNKTAEYVEAWLRGPDCFLNAIDARRTVVGVAMGTPEGEVLLNYVLPEARFTGVSKMLMRSLENYFSDRGVQEAVLQSTVTAERFYRSLGYVETGEEEERFGKTVRRFRKFLA